MAKINIIANEKELNSILEEYKDNPLTQAEIKREVEILIEQAKKYPPRENNELVREREYRIDKIGKSITLINLGVKEHEPKITGDIDVFGRRGQIEAFWKEQPFFYDKSKMFWLWDNENYKWVLSDVVDFLNSIQEKLGVETIDSKARGELEAGFMQIGRKHKPKDIKKSWVQFKDKIYDVKTGEEFEASPDYFVTNPIPWKVGDSEETPTIDNLFFEWVGEKDKQVLYEIIAYSISLDKFMQRVFALVGGGSNGKGTYVKLKQKFLGKENVVSSCLKELSENKFEIASLYRKLLCVMGEVSYGDLQNTGKIKQITGEDLLRFEFKGKQPFTEENTATCIILTNSLPTTPDKSKGFYRRFCIVDFPNEFKQLNKNLIEEIPAVEFDNLARKSLRILKELYENPCFTNEGDFEERAKKYEERSNPVMRFVEEFCEEEAGEYFSLREFTNVCNEHLKAKHLRVLTPQQVGKILRQEGFAVGGRKINDIPMVVIVNLRLINKEKLSKLSKLSNSLISSYIETNCKMDSSNSSNSFNEEKPIIQIEKPHLEALDFEKSGIKEGLEDG